MADVVTVFGHAMHRIEDYASHIVYQLAPEKVVDIPAVLAHQVADSFPLRICILGGQDEAEEHSKKCAKSKVYRRELKERLAAREEDQGYETEVMEPHHRKMHPQKRQLRRATLKRSGRARNAKARDNAEKAGA